MAVLSNFTITKAVTKRYLNSDQSSLIILHQIKGLAYFGQQQNYHLFAPDLIFTPVPSYPFKDRSIQQAVKFQDSTICPQAF